jgi:hypothetical protein
VPDGEESFRNTARLGHREPGRNREALGRRHYAIFGIPSSVGETTHCISQRKRRRRTGDVNLQRGEEEGSEGKREGGENVREVPNARNGVPGVRAEGGGGEGGPLLLQQQHVLPPQGQGAPNVQEGGCTCVDD